MLAVAMTVRSQQTPSPKFEVASIHRSDPDANTGRIEFLPGGRFRSINHPLRNVLSRVLQLDSSRIMNGPDWVNTERYAIDAKASDDAATEAQVREMVVALLVDRFHLKFHRESPETPVYLLSIDKKGPRLQASTDTTPGPIQTGTGYITGKNTTIALLATILTRMLGRPVVDETRLGGRYDFQLRFDPDSIHGPDYHVRESDASVSGLASIFTAIQEQMGLRLESTKRPIEALVIDSIERPAEN